MRIELKVGPGGTQLNVHVGQNFSQDTQHKLIRACTHMHRISHLYIAGEETRCRNEKK